MYTMISDEEKARIVEKIEFEREIRNKLTAKEEKKKTKSRWWWLESKLSILIIGAIISGILIPLFQFTQETIKWTRQNRYDNLTYRLEMVRNGTKELTFVHAFIAEAFERSRSLLYTESPDDTEIESYRKSMTEMHNRRFIQNAKFISFLSYFPEKERVAVRESFQEYLSSVQSYMMLLDNIAGSRIKTGTSNPEKEASEQSLDDALHSLMEEVDNNYEKVLTILRSYTGRLENESTSYM